MTLIPYLSFTININKTEIDVMKRLYELVKTDNKEKYEWRDGKKNFYKGDIIDNTFCIRQTYFSNTFANPKIVGKIYGSDNITYIDIEMKPSEIGKIFGIILLTIFGIIQTLLLILMLLLPERSSEIFPGWIVMLIVSLLMLIQYHFIYKNIQNDLIKRLDGFQIKNI